MKWPSFKSLIASSCLLVACSQQPGEVSDVSQEQTSAVKDSEPRPKSDVNGLKLSLAATGQRLPVGSHYKLDATVSNDSRREIVFWSAPNRFHVEIVETGPQGDQQKYDMPQSFGTHDLGAWNADIHALGSGASKTISWNLGHHVPGTLEFRVRYFNRSAVLTTEDNTITDVWTGELVSNTVKIEFVEMRDGDQ